MRDVHRYPITKKEQIEALREAAELYDEKHRNEIGGVGSYALRLLLEQCEKEDLSEFAPGPAGR